MVEKIFCNQCKEVSYTTTYNIDAPCPYCGFDIEWKRTGRKLSKRGKVGLALTDEWSDNVLSADLMRI